MAKGLREVELRLISELMKNSRAIESWGRDLEFLSLQCHEPEAGWRTKDMLANTR